MRARRGPLHDLGQADAPLACPPWTTPKGRSPRPSGSCARTGAKAKPTGVPYAYTEPSPGRYPWQWYWDSLLRGDRQPALRAGPLAGRAGEPARRPAPGRLHRPHDLLAPAGLRRAARLLQRRHPHRAADRVDPAAAARLGLAARGRRPGGGAADRRPGRLARSPTATSRATACSGSSSPTSRGSTPRPSSTRSGDGGPNGRAGFPLLVEHNRRLGWDARRIRDRGGPVLCETLVNTLWSLSLQSLGRPSATPALVERLWDEERGLFVDEAQPGGLRPAPVTWASLAPLALPDLPEAIGRRLVEEHLLNAREFLTPVAPPSVSVAERSYDPSGGRGPIRRYWRGPTWINSAWLVWLGMRRLGYLEPRPSGSPPA